MYVPCRDKFVSTSDSKCGNIRLIFWFYGSMSGSYYTSNGHIVGDYCILMLLKRRFFSWGI